MLDVFAEVAPGTQVPPTIHALLGARLDQLPGDERHVLEMAAVIGREFTGAEVDARRAMARRHAPDGTAPDDTAPDGGHRPTWRSPGWSGGGSCGGPARTLPVQPVPAARHRLHVHAQGPPRALAPCAGRTASARPGTPRSAGPAAGPLAFAYHVEAACLLRRELRPGDPDLPALASAAADALIAEGMQALARKDLPGAIALLERGREPAARRRRQAHHAGPVHLRRRDLGLWDEARSLAALGRRGGRPAG